MAEKIIKTIGSPKPIRMWIDGRCFVIKQFKNSYQLKSKRPSVEKSGAGKNPVNHNVEQLIDDIFGQHEIDFTKDESGLFSTSFNLPPIYYNRLNHINFYNLKDLSDKTETSIVIPKYGKGGKLVISGQNEDNIRLAVDELLTIVGKIREQTVPLQFLSIPLLCDEIKINFEKFKNEILAEKHLIKGMEESIFQSPLKLHLSIDVCVLHDNKEKQEAVTALAEFKDSYLLPLLQKNKAPKIVMSGIECMNDNYEKVDVLYAHAKIIDNEEITLQKIVNSLSNHFYERGLLKRYVENVKVHVTLINTKYRKDPSSPTRWTKRKSFDASRIMEKYKDFHFGTCNMDNIRLSLIRSKGEDGFYESLSVIEI